MQQRIRPPSAVHAGPSYNGKAQPFIKTPRAFILLVDIGAYCRAGRENMLH